MRAKEERVEVGKNKFWELKIMQVRKRQLKKNIGKGVKRKKINVKNKEIHTRTYRKMEIEKIHEGEGREEGGSGRGKI